MVPDGVRPIERQVRNRAWAQPFRRNGLSQVI